MSIKAHVATALRTCGVAVGLASCAVSAAAQSHPHVYFSGGWATASRDPGSQYPPDSRSPSDPGSPRSWIQTAVVTVGFEVRPWLGIEGAVEVQHGQSFPWKYSYLTAFEELASHRDTPIVGYVRFMPPCAYRVCVEPLVGTGFTWHHAESVVTADCGSGILTTCVPVTPSPAFDFTGSFEWTFAAGVDFPVHLSPRVSLAPTVRVFRISRREWLLPDSHRGPWGGGTGLTPTVGLAATWRVR